MKEQIASKAEEIYSYFRVKYRGNVRSGDLASTDVATIRNWAEGICSRQGRGSQWGTRAIFMYISFQYEYWSEKDLQFSSKTIQANMIFGEKAMARWEYKRDDALYWAKKYSLDNGIRMKDVIKAEPNTFISSDLEDDDRAEHYGTEEGFANCIAETSLWNPKSSYCDTCQFKETCKDVQKEMYFEIHLKRS